ncbi:MAG: hypothetical protein AAF682_13190 [Planctomycetota bacterium]
MSSDPDPSEIDLSAAHSSIDAAMRQAQANVEAVQRDASKHLAEAMGTTDPSSLADAASASASARQTLAEQQLAQVRRLLDEGVDRPEET